MKRVFRFCLFAASLALTASCFLYYTHRDTEDHHHRDAPQKNENYYRSLENFDDFKEIQGDPLSGKFRDVLSVKVVYEIRTGLLYFVSSSRYRYHYNFCAEALYNTESLEVFNSLNYGSSPRREYYLANLNFYTQSNTYALEFTSDDQIDATGVTTLYTAVKDHSWLKDSLKVLISSDHLSLLKNSGLAVPVVEASDIFNGQHYQPLNEGVSYGILRLTPSLKQSGTTVRPTDIIITKGTPATVPFCAGIITDCYQTPLSHINVLCHNRDIPSAAVTDIWLRTDLTALVGKPVKLSVTKDSVLIEAASSEQVADWLKSKIPVKATILSYDLSEQRVIPVDRFGLSDRKSIGNKAANFGELARISRKNSGNYLVPEGAFAIPFYFYQKHLSDPSIQRELNVLKQLPAGAPPETVSAALKRIRSAIKAKALDSSLLNQVTVMIIAGHAGNTYRFRSSSNAEDQAGFSGAGLYESKTGILGDTSRSIEKAIKNVWASSWNDEAWLERSFYGIDQQSTMMGILAHRSFPDESANGVAVTTNLYRQHFPGFTINVQRGEVSVVAPPDSVTCEQFVCMNANDIAADAHFISADYLTYSNINKGKPVLSQPQIAQLYHALDRIKSFYFYRLSGSDIPEYYDFALDVEFKFDKDGRLYIKQVRPYR